MEYTKRREIDLLKIRSVKSNKDTIPTKIPESAILKIGLKKIK